ncbi:Ulp1 family isopeptidase [Bradyrhizobium sp. CCBAU 11361]|uniref:Ulp1 family isopeptidase n=1 Tax=Bradyrhizobium sp. CCBAU 11361 TaxID=1630812 RepID=UPI0023028D86|nr:Ulp1 family isopeptidase [Bradyrhizobium sp. CCBAU 11361]
MERFNNINRAGNDSAVSDTPAEQSQQQRAQFEQHLGDARSVGPVYSHRELHDVSEEDDRLIQAASADALERRPPPNPTTVSVYDRQLRQLAAALKQSGKSIAGLDGDTLLGYAKQLFPNDKIIAPALLMVRRYRKSYATTSRPATTHHRPYRPSIEDERLIREASEAGFGRGISAKTAETYASCLRKLAAALRPLSMAKLGDDTLLGHADTLFQNDRGLISALNGLREYRAIIGHSNLGAEGGSSRQAIQPAAPSPMRLVDEQRLGDAADRGCSLRADGFNTLQLWQGLSSAAHSPIQSVAQNVLFDAAEPSAESPAPDLDAPVLWQHKRSVSPSLVQSFAQDELFDGVNWDGSKSADGLDASELWPEIAVAAQPPETVRQDELLDPASWPPSSRPRYSGHEDYFHRMIDPRGAASVALQQTLPAISESFDASLAVPEDFSHGTQPAPDMMRSKLGRWGLLPDAAQRVKTYDIRGECYAAVLGPGGLNDVQLIHLRSPAIGDIFDVSFAVPKDFSHCTQPAPDMMLSKLGEWDFLPNAEYPMMNYGIGGERYTAVLGPGGSKDVQLIHHPQPALFGEAAPTVPRASSDIYGGLALEVDSLPSFQLQERQTGTAGQAQFQRHLGEVRRANAAIPAPGIVVRPDPLHPHLSQDDLDLIDAAVQAAASRRKLRSRTVENYIRYLRKLGNHLKSEDKTFEGLAHASLIELAAKVFPKLELVPALEALRKYRERSAPVVRDGHGPVDGSRQDRQAAAPPVPAVNEEQNHHQGTDELTDARVRTSRLPGEELLINGGHATADLRPAKRQRTFNNPQGVDIERQLSDGKAGGGVLIQAPLAARVLMQDAGPPPSLKPTALHHQAPDFGEAVPPLNWRHGDQHAPDKLIVALDGSGVLPSQDNRPTSFVINDDRYTALLVPAGVMRQSIPLNQPGAAIRLNYRPENAPHSSAQLGDGALPELRARRMEQVAAASDRAEETSPALGETFDASSALPEGFSHGNQPASEMMLPRGEYGRSLLGPDGRNDVQLIRHTGIGSQAVPAAAAMDPSDIYGGLASLVDLPSNPQELSDEADYPLMLPRAPFDAQIGAASLAGRRGLELDAMAWLGDEHIERDYELLAQELQRANPDLAARTRFVDPLEALYRQRWGSVSVARGSFDRIVSNRNGEDTADFVFLPLNDASPDRRGTHWSLLFIDRRDREKPVAYHYDSIETMNWGIAKALAEKLDLHLEPARLAQQENGYDCGVFVVDGTRALVGRLAQGERPEHEPLDLDNLVADRRALQDRLRG